MDNFSSKENVVDQCIEEIVRLDTAGYTCVGDKCDYFGKCLRTKN